MGTEGSRTGSAQPPMAARESKEARRDNDITRMLHGMGGGVKRRLEDAVTRP